MVDVFSAVGSDDNARKCLRCLETSQSGVDGCVAMVNGKQVQNNQPMISALISCWCLVDELRRQGFQEHVGLVRHTHDSPLLSQPGPFVQVRVV